MTDSSAVHKTATAELNSKSIKPFARRTITSQTSIAGQSTTILSNGNFLLIGGDGPDGPTATASIKDPFTGTVIVLPARLQLARSWHTATLLPDGSVLIFGGVNPDNQTLNNAEVFDPDMQQFSAVSLPGISARSGHTATLLLDGRVLFAGGIAQDKKAITGKIQLWDPKMKSAVALPVKMLAPRHRHTATLLANGSVFFSGGEDANGEQIAEGEILDPISGNVSWSGGSDPQLDGISNAGAPYVTASIPQNGALDVSADVMIALRFSRLLSVQTISADNVTLTGPQGASVGIKVVGAESGRLAFIIPLQPLEPGTTYTLASSGSPGAVDETDFRMVAVSISFTTNGKNAQDGQSDSSTGRQKQNGNQTPNPPQPSDLQKSQAKTPAPDLPPLQAPFGVTALSGRVLDLNSQPVQNVTLSIGKVNTQTDATGRFLLPALPSGKQVLTIDGLSGSGGGALYGTFEVLVDIESGRTNVLPYKIWLPVIDTANATPLSTPTLGETVAKTPRRSGLEVHVPAGTVLRYPQTGHHALGHPSGGVMSALTITELPLDRPPFPLPPEIGSGATLLSLQMHGAHSEGPNGEKRPGVRIIYPNSAHLPAGSRYDLWNYDVDKGGWYVYGGGSVSADEQQVIPDPGVDLESMHCVGLGNPAGAPQKGPPCGSCDGTDGDPVDLATGLFIYSKTDFVLPDTIGITLTRTYRQNDNASRAFGIGSTHPYDMFLVGDTTAYSYADLILPNGGRIHFVRTSPGTDGHTAVMEHTATPTSFYKSVLSFNNTLHGWDLKMLDGSLMRFDSIGRLLSISDRIGNKLQITRDANGRVSQITTPNNRWLQLTYDTTVGFTNRITQIQDNTGRIVKYDYYATTGELWKVTDASNGVTIFTYDTQHRMQTITDPKSLLYITNEYDANSRVSKQTMIDGTTFLFNYTEVSGQVTQTDVTDQRSIVRRVTFNSDGYLLSDTRALGKPEAQTTTYQRQAGTNLVQSVTDPLGRQTTYSYYPTGLVQDVTWMAGTAAAAVTHYTYEPVFNSVASVTDPLSHTANYTYDGVGNLKTVTDPLTHQTKVNYNSVGQPAIVTDALGNNTSLDYSKGLMTAVTDGLGRTSKSSYDDAGRSISSVNAAGQATKYEYDNLNQVKKVTDPQGKVTQFSYDPNGNLLSVTDARNKVTSYTYDQMDRVLTRTDQLQGPNSVESYTYDEAGNTKTFTDRRGKVTAYTYDNLNRLSTVGFGRTGTSPSYTYESTISYSYDAANRLIQAVDSGSGTITRNYNDLTRTSSETTPQGSITYVSDAAGRLQSKTVAGQTQITYAFDNADRLTGITQGTSSVGFVYDNANRRTKLTLPNGLSMNYGYDNASQLASITYKNSVGTTIGDLTYGYDLAGRRISVGGSYAATGLPAAETGKNYNNANRLTQRGAATLAYDNNGNLTNDGVGNTLTWDARNQLTGISGTGLSASFSYDAFGRRINKTVNSATTKFFYDGSNAVQEQNASGTPTANTLSGGVDQVFTRTDSAGTRNFLIDSLGSAIGLTDNSGATQTSYTYDPFGQTIVSGAASNNTSQYTGRENDGTGLYFYRNRYYSPTLQRFVSEDPIGINGGINVYAFVNNDPVNLIDSFGLDPEVYYWSPYRGSRYGHLSMRLDDGTYISYWPTHEEEFYGSQPLNYDPARPPDFDRDKAGEGGREPERIPVPGIDQDAIKRWWNNGKGHGDYTIKNNCSFIVSEGLRQGGLPMNNPWWSTPDYVKGEIPFRLSGRNCKNKFAPPPTGYIPYWNR